MKPLRPRKSQDLCMPGLVWTTIGVPRGANAVTSKLKGPLKCSQAEMAGAILDWRSRFSVSSV